jgi:hypothetical protein
MGRVTKKRLSEIKGNSFVAARILSSGETLSLPSGKAGKGQMPSGGLEFSKAGFCWIYPRVFCSYQKSAESKMLGRCHSCPENIRAYREEREEDEAEDREVEEVFKRGRKPLVSNVDGKDKCPICGKPMVEMTYSGTNPSMLGRMVSGCEGDFMADWKEDGKIVWHPVKKRRRFPKKR